MSVDRYLLLPYATFLIKKTCFGVQTQGRESIAAKLVANLITEAGANRVLACDLHSGQSMGYFDISVDHVYGQVSTTCSYVLVHHVCTVHIGQHHVFHSVGLD